MKTITRRTVIAIGSVLILQAESNAISFQPGSESVLELFVDKTGLLSGKRHRFVFTDYSGKLGMDTNVEFLIHAASIVCKDTWVSAADIKKIEKVAKFDILSVERYPTIRYRSSGIHPIAANRFKLTGVLEIRGKSQPVEVLVDRTPTEYKGNAKVKLTDFGLKPPSAALGLIGTRDEINFSFTLSQKEE
jgi:polyisoprenoid-binding protein YceI